MTTRRLSLGLYGATYFGQFSPCLNWLKFAGLGGGGESVIITRSASADIGNYNAYLAGYLDADFEVSPTAPTDATGVKAIVYAQYTDMFYNGVPPLSGEVFQVSWTGIASSVTASGATVTNVNHTTKTATLTLATPATNTFVTLGISDHANPPRNIAVVQARYLNDVTLNGVTYPGWSNGGKFNPHWLDQIRQFKCIRFMDLMYTNGSLVTDYAHFATESYARWLNFRLLDTGIPGVGIKHGFPFSLMCEIATLTGCDIQINIPHRATDACVIAMANFFAANFPSTQKVWVEYSNECWNPQFDQTKWLRGDSDATGGALTSADAAWGNPTWVSGGAAGADDTARVALRYGYRAAQVMNLWRTAYGTANRSRWRGILGTWTGVADVTDKRFTGIAYWKSSTGSSLNPSDLFDAIHVTGYFDATSGDTEATAISALISTSLSRFNGGLEATKYDYFSRTVAEAFRAGGTATGAIAPGIWLSSLIATIWPAQKAYADLYGLALEQYEGGCHWLLLGSLTNDATVLEYYLAACHSADMARVYELSYAGFHGVGGQYPAKFVETGPSSRSGSWGGIRWWPMNSDADGDFDNPVWSAVTRATNGKARIKLS